MLKSARQRSLLRRGTDFMLCSVSYNQLCRRPILHKTGLEFSAPIR